MCLTFPAPTHAVVAMCTEAAWDRQVLFHGAAVQLGFTASGDGHPQIILLDTVALPMHHDTGNVLISQTP